MTVWMTPIHLVGNNTLGTSWWNFQPLVMLLSAQPGFQELRYIFLAMRFVSIVCSMLWRDLLVLYDTGKHLFHVVLSRTSWLDFILCSLVKSTLLGQKGKKLALECLFVNLTTRAFTLVFFYSHHEIPRFIYLKVLEVNILGCSKAFTVDDAMWEYTWKADHFWRGEQ